MPEGPARHMLTTPTLEFYVTGGTLRADAPSYVERDADRMLLEGLLAGEFCYVLTARQMGKSSLMVRTAQKLGERGVQVVALDLTAIGQNLTTEQWYAGLLTHAGQRVGQEEAMEVFWDTHQRLGPCQRFFTGLQEMMERDRPAHLSAAPRAWVVFVDEIDAVRSLPFSTDEFFAAIRECHNRRGRETRSPSLTFCLLGVAAPTDLIRDTRTTPFNVGRRIELADFSDAEALPLARGLERPGIADERRRHTEALSVLHRIVGWTGGHPYLTQRLCRAVAEANPDSPNDFGEVTNHRTVDRLCEALFLSAEARERDDNLLFVRERLLRSEADPAAVLDLYLKVLRGKRVPSEESNPLVTILRLSGVTRPGAGGLAVRNRIYERVFDGNWVTQNLPGAELRRQREAYRRGVLRAAGLAAGIIVVISALLLFALWNARVSRERLVRLYNATGVRRLEQGDGLGALPWFVQALKYGGDTGAGAAAARLRIGMLLAQSPKLMQFWTHNAPVNDVDIDPSGDLVVSAGDDGMAEVWEVGSGRRTHQFTNLFVLDEASFLPRQRLLVHDLNSTLSVWDLSTSNRLALVTNANQAVFDPFRQAVVVASRDGQLHWRSLETGSEIGEPSGPPAKAGREFYEVAPSPDQNWIAVTAAALEQRVELWLLDRTTGHWRLLHTTAPGEGFLDITFSPDGTHLAAGGKDRGAIIWSKPGIWEQTAQILHNSWVHVVEFSPDGNLLLTASSDASARLWYADSGKPAASPMRHPHAIRQAAFSPDGAFVVTCGYEGTARVWNTTNGEPVLPPLNHYGNVSDAHFSPTTNRLATAAFDGTVRLWAFPEGLPVVALRGHRLGVTHAAFNPKGDLLLTSGQDGQVIVWDVPGGHEVCRVPHGAGVEAAVFSPDGQRIATASWDGTARICDARTGAVLVGPLLGHQTNVICIAFASRGGRVATGDRGGEIFVWDAGDGRLVARMGTTHGAPVNHLDFSPDGRRLAAAVGADPNGVATPEAQVWDPADGRLIASIRPRIPELDRQMSVEHVAFSPDGASLLVSQCDDSFDRAMASLWRVRGRPELKATFEHFDGVKQARFSPSGEWVATASEDGTMRVWRSRDGKPLTPALRHGYQVTTIAFSADSRVLLTLSGSGTFRLWDALLGEPLMLPVAPPGGRASCAALSGSGRHVAVGTQQGDAFLWTLPSATDSVENLTTLVQLLAGYRLDENAVSMGLTGRELLERWRRHRSGPAVPPGQ